jgi:hypothetical protein
VSCRTFIPFKYSEINSIQFYLSDCLWQQRALSTALGVCKRFIVLCLVFQGWNLYVDEKEFADVLRRVEMTIAFRKGRERGGEFTYTELQTLTSDLHLLLSLRAILMELMMVRVENKL